MITARPIPAQAAGRLALVAGVSFAAALLAGCSGAQGLKSASAAMPQARPGAAEAKADKAVARTEAAVAKAPQDAAARAALGQAYLAAGRFASAATALNDAMTLGDGTGRTALSLALARIGSGHPREGVAILDDWREEIPAADLGLALALGGETARGVAVLADAVRGGDATPKLRQNLAYAYALDGRWAEAKLMAAQDVPADQLDKRMAFWALSMLPDRGVERIAGLIGAPARPLDPGQPAALALADDPARPQLAARAEPAPAPAPAPVEPSGELAPLAAAQPGVGQNLAVQQVVPAPAVRVRRSVAQAFADAAPAAGPRAVRRAAPRPLHVGVAVKPVRAGTHFVQLGAFASEQGARRAWGIYTRRDPGLAAFRMTITPATVNGRQVYRVAAGGLAGRTAATTLCSQVKAGGGACFAYAAQVRGVPGRAAPVPGVPVMAAGGPQRARR